MHSTTHVLQIIRSLSSTAHLQSRASNSNDAGSGGSDGSAGAASSSNVNSGSVIVANGNGNASTITTAHITTSDRSDPTSPHLSPCAGASLDPTVLLVVLRQLLALSLELTAHQVGETFVRAILFSTPTPIHPLNDLSPNPLTSGSIRDIHSVEGTSIIPPGEGGSSHPLPLPADGHALSGVTCDPLYRPRRPHGSKYLSSQSNLTAPSQLSQSNLTAPSQTSQSNLTSSLDQLAFVSRRTLAFIQPLVAELIGEINNRMGVRGAIGVMFDDISSPISFDGLLSAATAGAFYREEGYVLECVWMSLHRLEGSRAQETAARDLWISSSSTSSSSSSSSSSSRLSGTQCKRTISTHLN